MCSFPSVQLLRAHCHKGGVIYGALRKQMGTDSSPAVVAVDLGNAVARPYREHHKYGTVQKPKSNQRVRVRTRAERSSNREKNIRSCETRTNGPKNEEPLETAELQRLKQNRGGGTATGGVVQVCLPSNRRTANGGRLLAHREAY